MEKNSAMKIEAILQVDLDDLENVVGGKKKGKTTTQTADVTQDGSINFDLSGAGSVSTFFCPGDNSSIDLSVNQDSNVEQNA